MHRIFVVTLKELVDALRDRRTMLVTLVTAIAAGPLRCVAGGKPAWMLYAAVSAGALAMLLFAAAMMMRRRA